MKKLLILMLVLGLASVSQAVTVDLTVGGATEYVGTPDETITIDLIADLQCLAFGIGAVAETDAARNQILIGAAGGSVGAAVMTAPTGTLSASGYQDNYMGLLFDVADWYGDVAAGVVIASFSYTIASDWDGTTDYYVAPLAAGTSYEWASGSFDVASGSYGALVVAGEQENIEMGGLHIIPEPATMALLGLGSLFLMRRRK